MIIQINENRQCIDMIRELLSEFYAHTFEELTEYFPFWAPSLIENSLKILIRKNEVEAYELEGIVYYVKFSRSISQNQSIDERMKIKPALDFLRLMINSSDEDGCLVNNVPYISPSSFPHSLMFECNKHLYHAIYIPEDECCSLVNLINSIDLQSDNDADEPPYRIIVTDSEDYFDKIKISKIKYKVFINSDNSLVFEIGGEADD